MGALLQCSTIHFKEDVSIYHVLTECMYVCIYTRIDEGLFNFGFFSLILFSNINNNANAFG